jgi:PadR family transcriptional regulator PadR
VACKGVVIEPLRLTRTMTVIIKIFLAGPDEPHYGMEIMRQTGLSYGTVYPALATLRKHGWLTVDTEAITRLVVGIKYSVCLFRSARTVARDVRDLSGSGEPSISARPATGAWAVAQGVGNGEHAKQR